MKLDRNINPDGRGKYALVMLRVGRPGPSEFFIHHVLVDKEAIDYGNTPDTDFFVIRLKDKYAAPALLAYAEAAAADDPEYSAEILALANKAELYPEKRMPD